MPSTKNRTIVPSNVLMISKCNGGFIGLVALTLAGGPFGLFPTTQGVLMYSQGVPFVAHRVHWGKRWSQRRLSLAHVWHDLRRLIRDDIVCHVLFGVNCWVGREVHRGNFVEVASGDNR